ncbi:flavin reductase family protein [Bacillus sp. FJAT-50079]|uniref:flavin reductase family protein n=1 Tax=Bacillus sp. FJAT-50079 TaxID=2833577 RepID=UPI001BC9E31D|nr:flavin reductase family protein [Bacillus sp. FJAT-50079]MBS4210011.1 flavin reductase family protein [Bacillus sp. FJAT-50079]
MDTIQQYKEVMGNYPTGVTVVTTFDQEHKPVGLTVNSFASVSLDPLLILWSIDKSVSTYDTFLQTEKFAVNILAEDQADLCMLFASRLEDRFSQCDWKESEFQLPILSNTLAVLQCQVFKKVDAGDHTIFIGEVKHIHNEEKQPLLYHRRNAGAIPQDFYK